MVTSILSTLILQETISLLFRLISFLGRDPRFFPFLFSDDCLGQSQKRSDSKIRENRIEAVVTLEKFTQPAVELQSNYDKSAIGFSRISSLGDLLGKAR